MSRITLEQVLEVVKALAPEEQQQLRDWLDRLTVGQQLSLTEDQFEQKLVAMGIIAETKPLTSEAKPYDNYKPIQIKGKPLSEIIIEERR